MDGMGDIIARLAKAHREGGTESNRPYEPPKTAEPESKEPEPSEGGEKRRTILITKDLDEKLDWLADRHSEVNGVLFYRKRDRENDVFCPVYHFYVLGQGSPGHVISDPKRLEVANRLLEVNPDLFCVKFHTHSNGTIEECGEYFATNFSSQDIDIYRRRMEEDPEYIGMVVTPVTKLLFGRDDPELMVLDDLSEETSRQLNETRRTISKSLKNIATSKGYDHQFKLRR